jgi:dUTP pyrophosphatase
LFLPGDVIAREGIVKLELEESIQPAGIDLSVDSIEVLREKGHLGLETRRIPVGEPVAPVGGVYNLEPGAYRVRFREAVQIPPWAVGFCYPRSSLLRMGATLACAVWDPGYRGRGVALLVVFNPLGLRLEAGARIAQLVIARLEEKPGKVYTGYYQGEGLSPRIGS